jgi:hypothetical protein
MKPLTLEQKQNLLNASHNKALEHLQMYASGLITLTELTMHMAEIKKLIDARIDPLTDLLCPNTGLRYL